MIRHSDFERARSVFEFGCGTGRFAEILLHHHLPRKATYVGVDISETMVGLARDRLARFGSRAEVQLTDGSPQLNVQTAPFDRFVSNYVLDLLTLADIRALLAEAHRILAADGLLGLVSLTHGFTAVSRLVERAWVTLHKRRPALVGGCRPIDLQELIGNSLWHTHYQKKFSAFGIPSEVLVAAKALAS
ncbi:MAG: class I SAM-dependent methyltransferase [Acidiferrobacterales bacterium]